MDRGNPNSRMGFTIVELLVVIVVIGVLSAVIMVAYTGITQKAVASSLQSDLTNASKLLKMFQIENSAFPATIDCAQPDSSTNKCVKASGTNSYTYQYDNGVNPQTFTIYAANSGSTVIYRMTSEGLTGQVAKVCPMNFIVVPGSATYGTSDFCVMKYEARQASSTVPISRYSGLPWVNISQANSVTYSQNTCTGCHLMTEAEWLTLAQNVLSVPGNWSGGAVGSGYIYSGHNDNVPANALAADSNDDNGYSGTSNTSGNQKRTLTLTNGEVIWDLAGNVYEWTQGTIAGGQQPGLTGEVAYAWKQWNNGSLIQNGLPASAMPGYTGLSGASGWSSTQGIGQLYSNYGEAAAKVFRRGGYWNNNTVAGVLSLILSSSSGDAIGYTGFRVAK